MDGTPVFLTNVDEVSDAVVSGLSAFIDRLVRQAVAEEREACALIALGDIEHEDFPWCGDVREIAAAIRARGK